MADVNTVRGLRLWLADKSEDMPVEGTLRVGLSIVTMRNALPAPEAVGRDERVAIVAALLLDHHSEFNPRKARQRAEDLLAGIDSLAAAQPGADQ